MKPVYETFRIGEDIYPYCLAI